MELRQPVAIWGSVVRLGDAFDDCEAEADARVVGAYAFGAANKRLGKRGNCTIGSLYASVATRRFGQHAAEVLADFGLSQITES